jgi:hypothetical protein
MAGRNKKRKAEEATKPSRRKIGEVALVLRISREAIVGGCGKARDSGAQKGGSEGSEARKLRRPWRCLRAVS